MLTSMHCFCDMFCDGSRFHQLPGGLKDGVQLHIGVGVEMALGLVLNIVVLYAMGESLDGLRLVYVPPLDHSAA